MTATETNGRDPMTLAEAAAELGVAESTLRRQAADGRFAATKVGRDWITTRDAVAVYRATSLGRPGRRAVAR